jgi:hypothetical protein
MLDNELNYETELHNLYPIKVWVSSLVLGPLIHSVIFALLRFNCEPFGFLLISVSAGAVVSIPILVICYFYCNYMIRRNYVERKIKLNFTICALFLSLFILIPIYLFEPKFEMLSFVILSCLGILVSGFIFRVYF